MPIQIQTPADTGTVVTHVIPNQYRKLKLTLPKTEVSCTCGSWGMMIEQQARLENHLYSEQFVAPLKDIELSFATTEPSIILQIILSDEMEITYPGGDTKQQGRKIVMQFMLPEMPYKMQLHAGQQYHTAHIKVSHYLLEGLRDTFPLLIELFSTSTSFLLPSERFSALMRAELDKMKNSSLSGQALIHYFNNRISDVVISYLENVHRKDKPGLYEGEVAQLVVKIDSNPEETFNITEQAICLKITERALEIAFRQKMGTTILFYVQQQRILKAKLLLLTSTNTVADIAFDVGYSDPSYFNRVFKQVTGISPGKYRSDGHV
jgi:AraC-like DNA-binding protein